jgi:uncharacterized protein YkwD
MRSFASALSRRLRRPSIGIALLLSTPWTGCDDPSAGPRVGSNSNWLAPCAKDDDCGDDACRCGVCTRTCADDGDCAEPAGMRCATEDAPAAWAQCQTSTPAAGLCLEACLAGECRPDHACVGGSCVLVPFPSAAICADVAAADATVRTAEEQLLEALQTARREGAIGCGGDPAVAVPELRYDGRLTCVARVIARELVTTGAMDPVESDVSGRLSQVGYPAAIWGEAYAVTANGAVQALTIMASETASCPELVDPRYTEVGLGNSGEAYVAVFGSTASL